MSADLEIKLCVVGASGCGKTFLCQTIAGQPTCSMGATAGVRVQTLRREAGHDHVQVQLWDISGDFQFQQAWPVLAQGVDGVLLIYNPRQPEQEQFLEQLYLVFAQSHNLTMKQCCVLAVTDNSDLNNNSAGLSGKLSRLPSSRLHLGEPSEQLRKAALGALDRLLTGCIVYKRDALERTVMNK